jgi:hypothetical protein
MKALWGLLDAGGPHRQDRDQKRCAVKNQSSAILSRHAVVPPAAFALPPGHRRRLSGADNCRNAYRPVGGVLLDGRDPPPPDSPFKPVPVVVAGRGGS